MLSTIAPAVTTETPAPGAGNAYLLTTATATFNQSVESGTITFTLTGGGATVGGKVSYNSTTHTASFTPNAALSYDTTYTATVRGATNSAVVAMAAPFSWSFTTDALQPKVTSETPASGATGVAVSTTLSAKFNKSIQPATLGFTLTPSGGAAVAGTVALSGATNTATFTPSAPLAYNTTYTASITSARDSAFDPMSAPFTWTFKTDAAPPAVTSHAPTSGSTSVAVSRTASVTFNEAVQAGTIAFTLTPSGGTTVAGTVSYNSATKTAIFTPSAALAYNTNYTVTVSGAKDTAGDPMSAPFTWTFHTRALQPAVISHNPSSGSTTGVAVSKTASVTFNEAVQAGTINFTLTPSGGTAVAGTVAYNSTTRTATFTPSAALAYNTTYTATVSGAMDTAGDPMSAPFTWIFKTDAAQPAVIAHTPTSASTTGVAVSKTASVTFNEAIQAGTINFTLTPSGGTAVAGTVSYNSATKSAIFTPSAALVYNTTYTATVSGAKDKAGDPMSAPFTWTFKTDAAQPAVISHAPSSGSTTGVGVSKTASVTFNEAMQAGTINFTLTTSGGTAVAGTVAYNSATKTAIFTPSAALAYNTTYTATVSGAKDKAGDPMSAPFTWTFKTDAAQPVVISHTPTSGSTAGVAVSRTANVTFNEAIQAGTINFTLTTSGGSAVAGTVAYNSATKTATFTPGAALAYNTTYTATVSGAKDTAGDAMSAPFTWTFKTDAAQPAVTSHTPTSSSTTGVAVSKTASVTFNEAIQAGTINFTLTTSGGSAVAGTVAYNSATKTATFTPGAALAYNTTYTATVSGAKDTAGDAMSAPFTWTFKTDDAQPAIVAHAPSAGSTTGVAVSKTASATFNEAVQAGTINFTLTPSGGTAVAGTVSYNSATKTAIFTPSAALAYNTTYTATVSGAKDKAGDPMSAPFTWTFKTDAAQPAVIAHAPSAGSTTGVAVSKTASATFNEAVQAGTINFTLTPSGGTAVVGTVSYNSATKTAIFTPSAALAYNTTCTATVSGAKDTAGDPMSAPVTWSFTTDAVRPAVSSYTPASGATSVAVSSPVSATFNEAVQSGTISFTLTTSSGTEVAGTASYNSSTNTVTFTPSAALANGTTYTATVSGANDKAGDPMSGSVTWSFTTAAAKTTTQDLVAAYSFSQGSGTTVPDASGNGNTGTISNATWSTAGNYGDALLFNGTNAMVTVNNSASLDLTTAMTLEAWVDPSAVSSAWRDVVYKGSDNYWLSATSTQSSMPAAGATVGSSDVFTAGTAALAVNTWTFLAETFNGSTLALYVNGTQVSSLAQTGNILTSTDPLSIGGDSIYGQFFQGLIDEVRVYNVALTAAQIHTDMNTPVGSTTNTTPPSVTSQSPTNNATAVAVITAATATFNEAVQASTISFTLTNSAGSSVAATVAYNSSTNTATLTPSAPLAFSTTYTATVSAALSSSGVAMTAPATWSFTTAAAPTAPTAPVVTSETPASNVTGMATNTSVTATFNEPMQASSITTSSFVLKGPSGSAVTATVSYNSTTYTATLTPSSLLANMTTYTATLSGVTNAAANATASPFSWSFTTGPAPAVTTCTPAPNATAVAHASPLTATFNEPVQSGTISFTLTSSSGSAVAATVAYNSTNDTATLTPSAALAYTTKYTATVSGAEDTAGDPMTAPVTWSFTTGTQPAGAPTVAGETPPPATLGVAVLSPVTATFNQAVKSSTIVFTLTNDFGNTVAATLSYNSSTFTATLSPSSPLSYSTVYIATVSAATSSSGVAMTAPVVWEFITGPSPGTVAAESPASGTTGVSEAATITATFSEMVQASTINFKLVSSSGTSVPATVTFEPATFTAILTPNSLLAASTTYTATVSGAQDLQDDPMSGSVSWSFTTAASAPGAATVASESPASGATGVSNVPTVTATFNEPVQASTIVLTLKTASGATVPGTVSYNSTNDIAAFTPNAILAYSTTYTATISGAQNSSGVAMSGSDTWSFTTAAPPGFATRASTGEYILTDLNTIPNYGYDPTDVSVGSGSWSSASTWSTGQVPGAGAVVSIAAGTRVTYDADSTTVLGAITIQSGGTLQFSTTVNTEVIAADYLVLPGGTLDVGTQSNPIAANVTATIETANQAINTTFDPEQYGDSLIGLGNVTIYGAEKTPFVQLAVAPQAGATTLTLESPASGWQVGDTLYLPDSRQLDWSVNPENSSADYVPESETATIASISSNGLTVTLASALQFSHPGAYDSNGNLTFLPQVADETRNVVIRSQNGGGTRGIVMFLQRANVNINSADFLALGRTTDAAFSDTTFNSSGQVTAIGTNEENRVPVQFQNLWGPTTPQADGYQYTFADNTVNCPMQPQDHIWGVEVNNSSYGLIQGNFVDNWYGFGIGLVTGAEVNNMIEGNFVTQISGSGTRFANDALEGNAYWMQGPDNAMVNDVATDINPSGVYSYGWDCNASDVGTQTTPAYQGADPTQPGQSISVNMNATPVLEFSGNEVYGATQDGLALWWIGCEETLPEGVAGVVQNFYVWSQNQWGYFGYATNDLTIDGFFDRGNPNINDNSALGMWFADYNQTGLVIMNADIQGETNGIEGPQQANGEVLIENSYFQNVDNVSDSTTGSVNGASGLTAKSIVLQNDVFAAPNGFPLLAIDMDFVPQDPEEGFPCNIVVLDQVFVYNYDDVSGDNFQVYYTQQAASAIMLQTGSCYELIGSPVAGLTNQQNWNTYGSATAGAVAPSNATTVAYINGLVAPLPAGAGADALIARSPSPSGSTAAAVSGMVSAVSPSVSGPTVQTQMATISVGVDPLATASGATSTSSKVLTSPVKVQKSKTAWSGVVAGPLGLPVGRRNLVAQAVSSSLRSPHARLN